jgi:hypothetical protein
MVGNTYRLRQSASSLIWKADRQEILIVPNGAIVSVLEDPDDGSNMITVKWNRTKITMFAVDLEQRGDRLTEMAIGKGA